LEVVGVVVEVGGGGEDISIRIDSFPLLLLLFVEYFFNILSILSDWFSTGIISFVVVVVVCAILNIGFEIPVDDDDDSTVLFLFNENILLRPLPRGLLVWFDADFKENLTPFEFDENI
jgi:hypothetical protein